MISTQTLFHRLVATLLVLVATFSTALADESGTGWSYNSSTNTLTLSGSNVDWGTIKNFKGATKYVLFADDYSVTSIPDNAFKSFSKLERIEIPSAVTSIGNDAFYTCTSLYSVTLPSSLSSIGQYAFFYCSSLYSITLPSSLTSIGDNAFYACSSLGSVKILSDGTSDNKHFVYLGSESDKNATGSNVFPQNQATLVYDPTNTWIGDVDTQNLRYYFNKFSFQGTGWSYNSSTNTLTLSGDNVDWSAIKDFSSTTENVVFADDYAVNPIPNVAFDGFSKLTAIDIPKVVTSIGNSAFYGCSSLASVSLSASLTSIEGTAFDGCTSLASISLPEGLTLIGTGAFYGCASLTTISLPSGLTYIGGLTFYGCSSLASISLPEGLTSIGDGAFYGCSSLSTVTFPDGLQSIGGNAFSNCTSLASISLPQGLTSIGEGAFASCSSLTSITLPASLTSIGEYAFDDCTSLTSVEILSNGTSDDQHVIYLGSDTGDKTATGGDEVFPLHQATLIYDPATTWIGDDNTQNLRYYFNEFSTPTSIHSNTISNSTPQYYDLSGCPVSPTTHKGIAVKLQDGNSSLISIK